MRLLCPFSFLSFVKMRIIFKSVAAARDPIARYKSVKTPKTVKACSSLPICLDAKVLKMTSEAIIKTLAFIVTYNPGRESIRFAKE